MRALFWKIPRNYQRCGGCSGFTLIPKLTPEELDELYSDYYLEDGASLVASADDDSNNWMRKYKATIRFLRTQELDSKTFLDFSCGVDGYGIQVAKEAGLTVSGLEVSDKIRLYASFLLPNYGSRFWLVASKSIQLVGTPCHW
jgi:hypothetical protein